MTLISNLSSKKKTFVDIKHIKNIFDVVYFTTFKLNLCMTLTLWWKPLADFILEGDLICGLTSSKSLGFLMTCVVALESMIQFASVCSMESIDYSRSWSLKDVKALSNNFTMLLESSVSSPSPSASCSNMFACWCNIFTFSYGSEQALAQQSFLKHWLQLPSFLWKPIEEWPTLFLEFENAHVECNFWISPKVFHHPNVVCFWHSSYVLRVTICQWVPQT